MIVDPAKKSSEVKRSRRTSIWQRSVESEVAPAIAAQMLRRSTRSPTVVKFAFVDSSPLAKYKGSHPGRNSERSPWVTGFDVRITQQIPLWKRVKAEAYLSILNLGNLIDDSLGLQEEVVFSYRRAVAAASAYSATANGGQGQWTYTFNGGTLDGVPVTSNDTPVSRWQAQLGFSIKF